MKRYFQIFLDGKMVRFLIDEELNKELAKTLKSNYQFDNNKNLILDTRDVETSYKVKALLFQSILTQIKTFNLNSDLQKKINSLESYLDINKGNIYSSDIVKLNELINEASTVYNHARTNLVKSDITKEKRETNSKNTQELEKTTTTNNDYKISNTTLELKEIENILSELSDNQKLKNMVPINDIKDAISRIVICSSMEEFIEKTGSDNVSYNIAKSFKDKNSKILLPPNTELKKVVTEILSVACPNKEALNKVVTYVERKTTYQNDVNKAFDELQSNIKISGLNTQNLNYFGDQFINKFTAICKKNDISFDTMLADYFNGYSENRRYNSPLDRFIRRFTIENGGGAETRAMLEALIVKKAIAKGLVSNKFNSYLKPEYSALNTTNSGYIRFNDKEINNLIKKTGETSSTSVSTNLKASSTSETEISESSSISSKLNASVKSTTKEEFGLNFNDEIVNSVPDFEPRTDNKYDSKDPLTNNNQANFQSNLSPSKGRQAGQIIAGTKTITGGVRKINAAFGGTLIRNNAFNMGIPTDEEEIEEASDNELLEDSLTDKESNLTNGSSDISSNEGLPADTLEDAEDNPLKDMAQDAANNVKNKVIQEAKTKALAGAKEKSKQALSKVVAGIVTKHPYILAAIGIIFFIILIILIILIYAAEQNRRKGYFDSACNFNESSITLVACNLEKEEIESISLDDYVVKMAYIYTQGRNVPEEALKALMVILKTNALSYGNYQSSSKDLTVKICNVLSGGTASSWNFDVAEEDLNKLTETYNTISNYIFISSSYKGPISSLSSANAINFNQSDLAKLEEQANSGNNFSAILTNLYSKPSTNKSEINISRKNLYIGDSRTKGMISSSAINESSAIYGTGYGYDWLVGNGDFSSDNTNSELGGINGANAKMNINEDYNIVIWLGVNDISGGAERYYNKYVELAKGEWKNHNLYIVSVGPVNDSSTSNVKNSDIISFNNNMSMLINNANLSNLTYVNLGLNEKSITSYDNEGLHYENSDYQNITNIITSKLPDKSTVISAKLALYNLADNCTFYNVTENDSYWWPIGSMTPSSGNIYGGPPVSTTITSYFGPRTDPIDKKTKKGHGAIDIRAAKDTPVIATKNGTVNLVNKGCTDGRLTCGGGYGNHIKIDHGDGVESLYAHLNKVVVSNGETVTQGQIIGYSGNTGRSTGPHLHFEIRLHGIRVDPLGYVSPENPRPVTGGGGGDFEDVPEEGSSPAENKQIACKSLLSNGYSKNAVIGMLININAEGGFKTKNLENCYETNACCTNSRGKKYGYCMHPELRGFSTDDTYTKGIDSGAYPKNKFVNDHAGYGLIQWTSGNRKSGLYDTAKRRGKSIGSIGVQLEYLVFELKGYPVTRKYITGNYSAYDIANNFCLDFERPDNKKVVCAARARNNLNSFTNYVNNNCSG